MKGYDYYRDDLPRIVLHALKCGAAMYERVTVLNDSGNPIRYEKGRRLSADVVLFGAVEVITVYEPMTQSELPL